MNGYMNFIAPRLCVSQEKSPQLLCASSIILEQMLTSRIKLSNHSGLLYV